MERGLKNPDLHPLLGPHEGRELELMLKGEKPTAMFYYIVNQEEHIFSDVFTAFQPHVDLGHFIKREKTFDDGKYQTRYIFYSLPGYEKNIERLIEIKNYTNDPTRDRSIPLPIELVRETGELLGYPKEAIDYFVNRGQKNRANG